MATDTAEAAVADAANVLRGLPIQLESHAGFSEVLASLAAGQSGTLGGVWGSSRAWSPRRSRSRCPATLVVVLPHTDEVDSLADDLALFTDADVERLPGVGKRRRRPARATTKTLASGNGCSSASPKVAAG